jgi:hypothetical protein
MKYEIADGLMPSGQFEIIIRDVTRGIPENELLPETRIDLKVFNSEQEAEMLANQAAAAKANKGKK